MRTNLDLTHGTAAELRRDDSNRRRVSDAASTSTGYNAVPCNLFPAAREGEARWSCALWGRGLGHCSRRNIVHMDGGQSRDVRHEPARDLETLMSCWSLSPGEHIGCCIRRFGPYTARNASSLSVLRSRDYPRRKETSLRSLDRPVTVGRRVGCRRYEVD